MIAVFARANHPPGYGYPDGRAHGYSVVGVKCRGLAQVRRIIDHVARYGIDLPDTNDGRRIYPGDDVPEYRSVGAPDVTRWFSGGPHDWDYLFTVKGKRVPAHAFERNGNRGDNRFVAVYKARDLLEYWYEDADDHADGG